MNNRDRGSIYALKSIAQRASISSRLETPRHAVDRSVSFLRCSHAFTPLINASHCASVGASLSWIINGELAAVLQTSFSLPLLSISLSLALSPPPPPPPSFHGEHCRVEKQYSFLGNILLLLLFHLNRDSRNPIPRFNWNISRNWGG